MLSIFVSFIYKQIDNIILKLIQKLIYIKLNSYYLLDDVIQIKVKIFIFIIKINLYYCYLLEPMLLLMKNNKETIKTTMQNFYTQIFF